MPEAARAIKEKRGKRVVISAEPFQLHALVPAAIADMARDADFDCAIDICIRALGLWMARDNVDLAVVALPFTQTDLRQIVFAETQLVAVLPKGHALTARRSVRLQDLAANVSSRCARRRSCARKSTLRARAGFALSPASKPPPAPPPASLCARPGVTVANPVLAASFSDKGIVMRPLAADLQLTYGFLVPGRVADGHPVHRLMRTIARTAARLGGRFVALEPQWKMAAEGRP
jgi:hypothetical protein